MFRLTIIMVLAVGQRRDAQHPFKVADKAAVVIKAAVQSDFRNRGQGGAQVLAGNQGAQTNKVLAWAGPESFDKTAFQLALGKAETFGNIRDAQALGVVRTDILHDLEHRSLGVVQHALIALHNTAQPGHLAVTIE